MSEMSEANETNFDLSLVCTKDLLWEVAKRSDVLLIFCAAKRFKVGDGNAMFRCFCDVKGGLQQVVWGAKVLLEKVKEVFGVDLMGDEGEQEGGGRDGED